LIVVVLLFVGGSYVTARNTMVQKSADIDAASPTLTLTCSGGRT